MITQFGKQQGLGMVEVLVALVITVLGTLGILLMQSEMLWQSQSSKATAEGCALVQSRIEEMRNYTGTIDNPDTFSTTYAAVTNGNSTTLNGVNAAYTRTETIVDSGDMKQVSVKVAWTDSTGDTQTCELQTELAFQSPRNVGDIEREADDPLVTSPTGRAKLGEGAADPNATPRTRHDDNTWTYESLGDLKLVFNNQVVLTLQEACNLAPGDAQLTSTSVTCTDFVRISGRIYIDTASVGTMNAGDVFVSASDASFCSRYYPNGSGGYDNVDASTTDSDTPNTASGDYEYYDYTCYLGGGWHGNIGILLSGGIGQQDKFCQGDPISLDAWEEPVIAARRAYRGMLFRYTGSGTNVQTLDSGLVRYYTVGIADGATVPLSGERSHDFVVSQMPTTALSGDNCISQGVMVRADSYTDIDGNVTATAGALFEGVPTDFVCLNDGLADTASYDMAESPGEALEYGINTTCPYDPTDPPISKHIVSGGVTFTGFNADSDVHQAAVRDLSMVTSDGEGNCTDLTYESGSDVSYDCQVFDWGNGWTGYTELKKGPDADGYLKCLPQRNYLSSVTADVGEADYTCDFGNVGRVRGAVDTFNATKVIETATISDSDLGGLCAVALDGMSYACETATFLTDTWSGTITFTTSGGVMCDSSGEGWALTGGVLEFSALAPAAITNVPIVIKSNSNQCPL